MELGQGLFLGNEPVQLIQNNNFVSTNPFYFDDDAIAFLEAAQISDGTTVFAINNLVIDLKSAGLWTKMNAVYPFVGGTATTQKYNLLNPQDTNAAYRLTFSGNVTHSLSGFESDGVNGYATSYLNMATQLGGGQNDSHLFMYLANMYGGQTGVDMGASDAAGLWMNSRNPSNVFNSRHNNVTTNGIANSLSAGCFTISRTGSSSYLQSINKSHTTVNNASTATANKIAYIGALHGTITSDYQNRLYALVTLGYGLTSGEIDDLVDINETFQTALGRFV